MLSRSQTHEKLIFFTYSGETSMSANLANRIKYEFPDKYVVIGYKKPDEGFYNFSLRGNNIRDVTLKAIEDIENSTGGGHQHATGARIPEDDLHKFKENIEKAIEDQN